ncbi:MAG: SDR family NAD(P)-dependent oxidoreductase, partial [Mucilaginibacter sp.]
MKTLSNKVALVTGAGSGIGKAIAMLFAAEGAKVILADVQQVNIEAVAKDIKSNGGQALCFAADVSREADIKLLIEFTLQNYKTLDILVNNAGVMDNFTP